MLQCGGDCGVVGCQFRADCASRFAVHVDPERRARKNRRQVERVRCPVCQKEMIRGYLTRHKRTQHGIASRVCRRCPPEFDPNEFAYVKQLVSSNLQADERAGRGGAVSDRHAIAVAIYKRWQSMGDQDDNGGNCTGACKIVLRPHSLFSLTLDRMDDLKPHFVNDTLDNLCFTIRGMNVWSSLRLDDQTCARLRVEMRRTVSAAEVAAALLREKTCSSIRIARSFGFTKKLDHILYKSVSHAFHHDPKARAKFVTVGKMFSHCYALYAAAGARCALNGIFLSGHAYNRVLEGDRYVPHPFQPSVDAVVPSLGHVPGNLRIICRYLNATDKSKLLTLKRKRSAVPHAWSRELWFHYVGANGAI